MITLSSLIYYPIKACRGHEVESWNVERMERAALVDAYLRHDVAAILRLVQLLAEDAESKP